MEPGDAFANFKVAKNNCKIFLETHKTSGQLEVIIYWRIWLLANKAFWDLKYSDIKIGRKIFNNRSEARLHERFDTTSTQF